MLSLDFEQIFFSTNLDLLFLGVVIAIVGVIASVVFFSNHRSITNITFLFFGILTILYGIFNYANYQATNPDLVLWLLRLTLFAAIWHAFFFFQLFYVIPKEKVKFPYWYKYIVVPLIIITSGLTLTPLMFSAITEVAPTGEVTNPERGYGIFLFALVAVSLVFASLSLLFKKYFQAKATEKKQFEFIFIGSLTTITLLVICNVILPLVFDVLAFVPFAPVYLLPFIVLTAYAIIRHQLLDIKIVATEILSFILAVVTLLQIVFSTSTAELVFNISTFVLVLVFSILLIKSVMKEIESREEIERLAKDLEKANGRLREMDRMKSEFVSIASHQLRSPITAIKGYASLVLEGSYGKVPDTLKEAIQKIFDSSQLMVLSIEDFLNVSRIEQGRMKYDMTDFDLQKIVDEIVGEMQPLADKQNLTLKTEKTGSTFMVHADYGKIKQVVANLVDNALKYTKEGSIVAHLKKEADTGKVHLTIKDTGIGMSKETLSILFERFVRAKGANKVNVSGTGLGLYVARQLVEAHKGRIWAESAGEGQGSSFHVELPAKR